MSRELAPGVSYRKVVDAAGPWVMHVVRVSLRQDGIELREGRALDRLTGRERTSAIARRAEERGVTVLAAVNADFFDLETGENENNQVIAGEWWKGLKTTDSPYDTFDNAHVQLAIDASGRPVIDRFILDARAWARGVTTPILTLNHAPTGSYEGTALYTPRFGPSTPPLSPSLPRDTARTIAEAVLEGAGSRGDTLLMVRRGAIRSSTGAGIPPTGAVLSAYGSRVREVQAMADGDTVKILLATQPRLARGAAPRLLIGGWPRLLRDGENVAGEAATVEGTISRNAEIRHPRTVVGISQDGETLTLLTVDGRSKASVGMTLVEVAERLRRLGVWNAMNFDGGGSTAMVLGGALVNVPSDSAGERAVGNALLVVRRR